MYTLSSMLKWVKDTMAEGFVLVTYNLKKVYFKYDDIPTGVSWDGFLYHPTDKKKVVFRVTVYGKENGATYKKLSKYDAKGVLAEMLENYDAIAAGTYKSKAEINAEKEAERVAKRKAKEASKQADCKTFNVDFFNHDELLAALTEIAERLCNGQYSDLNVNDIVKLEYRTDYKSENKPYVVFCGKLHFEYEDKYGDLWEDLMDRIETEVLSVYLNGSGYGNEPSKIEKNQKRREWLNKYLAYKKENPKLTENDLYVFDTFLLYYNTVELEGDLYKRKYYSCWQMTKLLRDYFLHYTSTSDILKDIQELKDELYYQEHKEEIDKQRAEEAAKKKAEEERKAAEEAARKKAERDELLKQTFSIEFDNDAIIDAYTKSAYIGISCPFLKDRKSFVVHKCPVPKGSYTGKVDTPPELQQLIIALAKRAVRNYICNDTEIGRGGVSTNKFYEDGQVYHKNDIHFNKFNLIMWERILKLEKEEYGWDTKDCFSVEWDFYEAYKALKEFGPVKLSGEK